MSGIYGSVLWLIYVIYVFKVCHVKIYEDFNERHRCHSLVLSVLSKTTFYYKCIYLCYISIYNTYKNKI